MVYMLYSHTARTTLVLSFCGEHHYESSQVNT